MQDLQREIISIIFQKIIEIFLIFTRTSTSFII